MLGQCWASAADDGPTYILITGTNPEDTRRWNNGGLTLGRRRRRWTNVKLTLIQRVVPAGNTDMSTSHKTHSFTQCWINVGPGDIEPMLISGWTNVVDNGPSLNQHWVNVFNIYAGSIAFLPSQCDSHCRICLSRLRVSFSSTMLIQIYILLCGTLKKNMIRRLFLYLYRMYMSKSGVSISI